MYGSYDLSVTLGSEEYHISVVVKRTREMTTSWLTTCRSRLGDLTSMTDVVARGSPATRFWAVERVRQAIAQKEYQARELNIGPVSRSIYQ